MSARRSGARRLATALAIALLSRSAPARAEASAEPVDELAALRAELAEQRARINEQQRQLGEQLRRNEALAAQVERLAARLATAEGGATASGLVAGAAGGEIAQGETRPAPELPTEVVTAGEIPGSIRLPGSDQTVKLGGLVRFSMIRTLAPLGSDDRFLTHSIPVGQEDPGDAERFRTNVRPSRLNLDVRTPLGDSPLRAFLEGDFASSSGNSFRLRHAYLQWSDLLVGQTWSTFSDPESEPEDLDFEGLNSLNTLRQPQVRWSPRLDQGRLTIALEDSEASIAGAESVNRYPNLVVGHRVREEWGHLFAAVSLRDLRGQADGASGSVDATAGWGVTVAGRRALGWNRGRDEVTFQLTTGEGVATYVADLSAAGGQDAVYDAEGARIRALPAAAVSLGYLHAWPEVGRLREVRSSLVAGYVEIDNLAGQPDDAYHRTLRLSANLVTSPARGVDLGLQYIWGRRENKSGARGTSSQVQFLAQYRF